ncbi:TPA: hypothetical protein DIV55_05330 [Patescibacteria group bacterium]|uniref:Membrane protein 6-pyruvoyl-tetrahydropterin synthase-related domain-containing protein n=1 Tax=Candidatus Gottesmanbacteria bacterium GW2011_GWA1_43_11 TaxID=1618436 RepID=A0A0G1FHM8_9BACT|nr:MAG: hypothetical protein UV59_C0001G0071 [Candidatus Gottesmanbacteria bacterium GW2011_GWA1_43_11]HCS79132.1 hypothetical protein [Patescibacteria group bacterium]
MHTQSKFLLGILILSSVVAMKSLFHTGFYTSHDGWHQVARLYHWDRAFKDGQIPPRYSFELLYGNGYPLFTFNYHLPWIIAEPLVIAGVSLFDAIKFVFFLGFVVSGLTMYLWQRELWKNDLAAFVAAFLYLWAPYRFSNIFVRASLGEATSFIFLPLFFYGLHRIAFSLDKKALIIGSLGITGLLLSHVMIMYLLFIPAVLYTLALFFTTVQKKRFLLQSLCMGVIAILLSAYYLVPAVAFQNLTRFSSVQEMAFLQQFPSFKELLYSPWGYAASRTGPGEMALQLGITQWVAAGFGTLLLIYYSIRKLNTFKTKKQFKYAFVLFGAFLFALFLTQKESKPIWQLLKQFPIDFPWRFLSPLTLLSAALAGFVVSFTHNKIRYVLTISLIFLAIYANRNHLNVNQYTDIPVSLYVASERTTNTFDEYLPKWANLSEVTQENRIPVKTAESTKITHLRETSSRVEFNYQAESKEQIQVRVVYFPGISLRVDNQRTVFSYKDNGYINFAAPAGIHTVRVVFQDTVLGKTATLITATGIIIAFGIYFGVPKFRKYKLQL